MFTWLFLGLIKRIACNNSGECSGHKASRFMVVIRQQDVHKPHKPEPQTEQNGQTHGPAHMDKQLFVSDVFTVISSIFRLR